MERQDRRHPGLTLGTVLLALLLLLPAAAQAQQAVARDDSEIGLLLGARGIGEVLQEPTIGELYRSSRLTVTGFASYRVWRFVHVDVEVGYGRTLGDAREKHGTDKVEDVSALELIPIAIMGSAVRQIGEAQVFASVGTAITVFGEDSVDGSVRGTKYGASFQLGTRLDTGLVRPTMRPGDSARIQSVDLEIVLGRRQHQLFGVGEGWNLSAWRVGIGLLARF